MMRTLAATFFLIAYSCSAAAETCPATSDHTEGVDALIKQIQKAESQSDARVISDQLWTLWTDAPDARSQILLDRGMARREAWDLLGALDDFNQLVDYCPNFAEGYNQRAFVNYLRQDFDAALQDLNVTIKMSPNHIGALSGRALALLGLKRLEDAREALSEALELNPWLSERALLEPGGLLDPPGEDI
ncbi:tetratricopeptide repeat protein [uncultured Ruegeria sp.]|uniref:tetratricopeptide repeat protein n=1 Tax=uncultured Ruegeria sp. TaxID=259304 RepID=UPI0026339275|nr:tetratricopeptide repeat protein [uncultured Ruegeria sp.]